MNNVQWIKLKVDIFDDEKIRIIEKMENGDSIIVIWLKMLTHAGKINDDGMIYLNKGTPFSLEMLSIIYGRDQKVIKSALDILHQFEMIDVSRDSGMCITNWEKHQNVEQLEQMRIKTKERVRKYRERKRSEECNVTCNVTVTSRNAIEKRRKDIYIDQNDQKPVDHSDERSSKMDTLFKEFWDGYPRKLAKKKCETLWKQRIKEGVSPDDLIKSCRNYAQYCEDQKKDTEYIMHPARFLNKKLEYEDYLNYGEKKKEDTMESKKRDIFNNVWKIYASKEDAYNESKFAEWYESGGDADELRRKCLGS